MMPCGDDWDKIKKYTGKLSWCTIYTQALVSFENLRVFLYSGILFEVQPIAFLSINNQEVGQGVGYLTLFTKCTIGAINTKDFGSKYH